MNRLFALLGSTTATAKAVVMGVILLAGSASFAEPAHAATAYYVRVTDVYARNYAREYAMGRLYTDQRIDIQYIDSNGWGYGYAYGYVNRCVWVQYSYYSKVNFWTNGTTVSNKCRDFPKTISTSEFTNGEIWKDPYANDGKPHRLTYNSHRWDNWAWSSAWGNHRYRGIAYAGEVWRIRYTTKDGAGVMARGPCWWDSPAKNWRCPSDWQFIQRGTL
jgi:hypothetical protein